MRHAIVTTCVVAASLGSFASAALAQNDETTQLPPAQKLDFEVLDKLSSSDNQLLTRRAHLAFTDPKDSGYLSYFSQAERDTIGDLSGSTILLIAVGPAPEGTTAVVSGITGYPFMDEGYVPAIRAVVDLTYTFASRKDHSEVHPRIVLRLKNPGAQIPPFARQAPEVHYTFRETEALKTGNIPMFKTIEIHSKDKDKGEDLDVTITRTGGITVKNGTRAPVTGKITPEDLKLVRKDLAAADPARNFNPYNFEAIDNADKGLMGVVTIAHIPGTGEVGDKKTPYDESQTGELLSFRDSSAQEYTAEARQLASDVLAIGKEFSDEAAFSFAFSKLTFKLTSSPDVEVAHNDEMTVDGNGNVHLTHRHRDGQDDKADIATFLDPVETAKLQGLAKAAKIDDLPPTEKFPEGGASPSLTAPWFTLDVTSASGLNVGATRTFKGPVGQPYAPSYADLGPLVDELKKIHDDLDAEKDMFGFDSLSYKEVDSEDSTRAFTVRITRDTQHFRQLVDMTSFDLKKPIHRVLLPAEKTAIVNALKGMHVGTFPAVIPTDDADDEPTHVTLKVAGHTSPPAGGRVGDPLTFFTQGDLNNPVDRGVSFNALQDALHALLPQKAASDASAAGDNHTAGILGGLNVPGGDGEDKNMPSGPKH
jgi:hypothetical protein